MMSIWLTDFTDILEYLIIRKQPAQRVTPLDAPPS